MQRRKDTTWPHSGKWIAAIWIASCVAAIAVHVPTLTLDPLLGHDEAQILDYGRIALNPDTSWGIVWDVDRNAPILLPTYIGAMFQELGFRLTEPSVLGARLTSTIAAALAASCLLGWLIARRVSLLVSLVLALAFLMDPVFSANYRGGRVDAWAIAACLGSCWLLRHACLARSSIRSANWQVLSAGFLAGLAPFLWPNAIILWPLVVLELANLVAADWRRPNDAGSVSPTKLVILFAFAGFFAVCLGCLPALFHWEAWWQGLHAVMAEQAFAAVIKASAINLLATHNPGLVICLALSLFYFRDWGLLLAVGVALIIVYQTMVYLPRVMYLIPYCLAIVASAVTRVMREDYPGRTGKFVLNRLIAVLLIWNIADTIVLRTYLAMARDSGSDYAQVIQELDRVIGAGPQRVLNDEWSAYAAGRQLGWKQFRSGTQYETTKFLGLMKSMDYVVLKQPPLWQNTVDLLEDAGFELLETVHFRKSEPVEWSVAHLEIRYPSVGYPSMTIYRKVEPGLGRGKM